MRDPEIEQLGLQPELGLGQKYVLGLDVAVHDAALVHDAQRVHDRQQGGHRLLRLERALLLDARGQVFTREQLEHDERIAAIGVPEIQRAHDRRVAEARGVARFLEQAFGAGPVP